MPSRFSFTIALRSEMLRRMVYQFFFYIDITSAASRQPKEAHRYFPQDHKTHMFRLYSRNKFNIFPHKRVTRDARCAHRRRRSAVTQVVGFRGRGTVKGTVVLKRDGKHSVGIKVMRGVLTLNGRCEMRGAASKHSSGAFTDPNASAAIADNGSLDFTSYTIYRARHGISAACESFFTDAFYRSTVSAGRAVSNRPQVRERVDFSRCSPTRTSPREFPR